MSISGGFNYKGTLEDAKTLASALEIALTVTFETMKELDQKWQDEQRAKQENEPGVHSKGEIIRSVGDKIPGMDEIMQEMGRFEQAYFQITGARFKYPKL